MHFSIHISPILNPENMPYRQNSRSSFFVSRSHFMRYKAETIRAIKADPSLDIVD